MGKQERIKTILGICLLSVLITGIFSLIQKISSFFLNANAVAVKASSFLLDDLPWIAVIAAIIIFLSLLLKKMNGGIRFRLLRDPLIRVTAGMLAILDGILNLSETAPVYVASIQNTIQASHMMGPSMQRFVQEVIVTAAVSVFLSISQILAGLYLAKFYQEKPPEHDDPINPVSCNTDR